MKVLKSMFLKIRNSIRWIMCLMLMNHEYYHSIYTFERSLFCSPRLHVIGKKYSKIFEILLQNKIAVFYVHVLNCIFSIITPVFSVTWSSEIIIICWFAAQNTFLIINNIENSYAAKYFYWKHDTFFTNQIHKWIESSKEQHLFEI